MQFEVLGKTTEFLNETFDGKKVNVLVNTDIDKLTAIIENLKKHGNVSAFNYKGAWVLKLTLQKNQTVELDKHYLFTIKPRKYNFLLKTGERTKGHSFTTININKNF